MVLLSPLSTGSICYHGNTDRCGAEIYGQNLDSICIYYPNENELQGINGVGAYTLETDNWRKIR